MDTRRPGDHGIGHHDGHSEVWIDDDELAREALAADPDREVDPDATPFGPDEAGPALLPEWYMPTPRGIRRTPGRRVAVAAIIAALVVVNGAGLCVTHGVPEIAW